jgi:virginiamycin B lyase
MGLVPKTNKVIKKFGPPAGSGALHAGNDAVWITAHDINKVWRLDAKAIKNSD